MNTEEALRHIVPADLFDVRWSGTPEQIAMHLIRQCHPAATAMQVLAVQPDEARAEIPYAMENRALHGFMHGGCFFTVGDTLTALMCLFQVQDASERMLTAGASIRYLRPVGKETVQAVARLAAQEGRRFDFVVDFYIGAKKRAAQAKYRYMIVAPRAAEG